VLNLPRAQDLPGRFLAQGTVVGTLVRQGLAPGGAPAPAAAPATWHVRVALEAEQATDIEARASGIAVHLPTPGAASIPATLARDARAATRELPSAALGDRFGGAIVTDPADPQGRTAARDVVLQVCACRTLMWQAPHPLLHSRLPFGSGPLRKLRRAHRGESIGRSGQCAAMSSC
jgi:hypothetical protein